VQPGDTALNALQNDGTTMTDLTLLTVMHSTGSSHHSLLFAGNETSLTAQMNTGSSCHPLLFTGDPASRAPAPMPVQDMFYCVMSNQPAWAGQQNSSMFDFMDLLKDQGPDSAFVQGFSSQVKPFDLHHPSHLHQASLAPLPSTNIITPTPLKDANTAHTPTPGLS
jgi:hypothetical protein